MDSNVLRFQKNSNKTLMKKILLILIFMTAWLARGQDYAPIACEGCTWSSSSSKFTFMGDTLINDLTYSKVYFHFGFTELTPEALVFAGSFREDIATGKSWIIVPGNTDELLLYDFTLEVSDQIQISSLGIASFYVLYEDGFLLDEFPLTLTVESVDNLIINSENRKVIQFQDQYNGNDSLIWIEGIGSNGGLLFSADSRSQIGLDDVWYPELLCVEKNDQIVYDNPFWDSCYKELIGDVGDFAKVNSDVTLFFDSNSHLILQSEGPVFENITVFDSMGRVCYQSSSLNLETNYNINASNWPKGLYIVNLESNLKKTNLKIIKQ